ncbi:MAG: hypothetical protein JWO62_1218 [Acidimicrobiaceae bacterium]|nr:hypothetical protein [Acidimicrobiaceae bacterium]
MKTVNVCTDSDEIGTGRKSRPYFSGDRAQSTAPPVPVHRSADLAADGIRDEHLATGISRNEVYRDWPAPSPPGAAYERAEGLAPMYGRRAPGQADRRTRPLRRRAFKIAWPARVDMRWRKPWRLARFLVFGW